MSGSSPLKVVCALIFEKGQVLATRRDPQRSFPLMWEFPGGKLENGELPEEALHRELEEELRLKVEVLEALPNVNYQKDDHHIELIPFLCRPAQRHAPVPVDHVEVRWIEADVADHLTWAPADIPLVAQVEQLTLSTNHE